MATQAKESSAPATTGSTSDTLAQRQERAEAIVRRNIYWAMGAGAIPVPLLDFVAITGVQVKLLKQLSNEYEVPFFENKVKNLVGSLVSASLSVGTGTALIFSVLKIVPILGSAAGLVSVPIAAGAITYATGKVFIQHFESGGTFLDFDPKKVRDRFNSAVEQGKDVAAKMQTTSTPSTPSTPSTSKPS
jgi:uncharacterized protein (DUF697 family)